MLANDELFAVEKHIKKDFSLLHACSNNYINGQLKWNICIYVKLIWLKYIKTIKAGLFHNKHII